MPLSDHGSFSVIFLKVFGSFVRKEKKYWEIDTANGIFWSWKKTKFDLNTFKVKETFRSSKKVSSFEKVMYKSGVRFS